MIVEISRAHIIKTLLDPTEPLIHGSYGYSVRHQSHLSYESPTKKNCKACAVGTVIRSILNEKKSTINDMAITAKYTCAYRAIEDPASVGLRDLEAYFERNFKEEKKFHKADGTPNMRGRRNLAAWAKKFLPVWVKADVNGLTAAKLKKAKVVRILEETNGTGK